MIRKEKEAKTSVEEQFQSQSAAGKEKDCSPESQESPEMQIDDAAGEETSQETSTHTEEELQQQAALKFMEMVKDFHQSKADLEAAKQEIEEAENRYARLLADFDNYKRRTKEEKEDLAKYASAELIKKLLPVVDNFERALMVQPAGEEAQKLLSGVEMIFRQMTNVLCQEGLCAMNAPGTPFDPNIHEAVMFGEASEDCPDGHVLEEMQKGYFIKEKCLRPAMVKVARG